MRLYGLDVIRFVSFLAISGYHFIYVVWRNQPAQYDMVMSSDRLYKAVMEPFMHALSHSGFSILLITTFLIGFRNLTAKIHWRLFGYVFIAWLLFSWADQDFKKLVLYWEVYPLLIVGLVIVEFAHKVKLNLVYALGTLGFALTWVQFAASHPGLPLWIEQSLFGTCAQDLSNFPILPWVGLVAFGYGLGLAAQQHPAYAAKIKTAELWTWVVLLISASFNLGAFFNIHAMDFECKAFHVPPLEYWSHMVFILFLMRISLVDRVNEFFRSHLSTISRLQTSKNFFLVYAVQYLLCFVVAETFGHQLRENAPLFSFALLAMWPLSEAVVYVIAFLKVDRFVRR
jgi:hypothetical protein